jgi:Uma2 family endonuclease
MVAASRKRFVPPNEYIARERKAEFRSEYWNGEMIAMAGESRNHNRILRNLTRHLGNQLDGSPCEPFSSETRVRVPECNSYFYPDALIVCGEGRYENVEAETLLDPAAIMEVLSPATEAADRGRKFACYRTLPSLMYYVLIEQDAPGIDLYVRQEDGRWLLSSLSGLEAMLVLDRIGVSLRLADIYERISFASENTPNT